MKVLSGKVADSLAARDRASRPKWQAESDDFNLEDYAPLIRSMLENFITNKGAFKIGGNLSVEYEPKESHKNPNMRMTTDTAFFFHMIQDEGQRVNSAIAR
jgi:hypothetical protein